MKKSLKHFCLLGNCGIGKSHIANSFLDFNILPPYSNKTEAFDNMNKFQIPSTQFPILVYHDTIISLSKFENGILIYTSHDSNEIYQELTLKRNLHVEPLNIHFVLSCPFKPEFEHYIITDLPGISFNTHTKIYYTRIINSYVDFIFNTDNHFFKFNSAIYVTDKDMSNFDDLDTITKENYNWLNSLNIPIYCVANLWKYEWYKNYDRNFPHHKYQNIVMTRSKRKEKEDDFKNSVNYLRELYQEKTNYSIHVFTNENYSFDQFLNEKPSIIC